MAQRGAAAPAGRAAAADGTARERTARRHTEAAAHAPRRTASPLAESEPGVERALRAVARTHELTPLERHELAPRLREALRLESDEDAEALLGIDVAWMGYSRPEDVADVAALLPADLHGLRGRAPLLKTPRWKRLRLGPP